MSLSLAREESMARKRARWGPGEKKKEHTHCPHPVKGSHDPKVDQCCECGEQLPVKEG